MSTFQRLVDSVARCLGRLEHAVAERPLLVAVSGGNDSTALLFALARLRDEGRLSAPLHAAHIDHRVHEHSRAAAQAVLDLCDRLDVPMALRTLSLPEHQRSEQHLREARYQALQEIASGLHASAIATAHHADDNLETVLFRMLRGTGPRGLAGIPEARWLDANHRVQLIRPLLKLRRSTLEEALRELQEREVAVDPTNRDLRLARNRLRLQTMPSLREQLGIDLDLALLTVCSTARAATEILTAQSQRILRERCVRPQPWRRELDLRQLDADSLPFVSEALRTLHLELRGTAPLRSWLQRATELLAKPHGSRLAGRGGILVERTAAGLLLVDPARAPLPSPGANQVLHIDQGSQRFFATEWQITAHEHPHPPLPLQPNTKTACHALLDPRVSRLPWSLRTKRAGDAFHPLGGEGNVDLRRFMQHRHVPRFDRDRLPLLVDADDRVLWVPGYEISERARLLPNTRRCILLSLRTAMPF